MKQNSVIVKVINGIEILVIEVDGKKRVPIRPICDAIGVTYQGQIDKIKEDDILGSTLMLSLMVGADGKEREMQTIPYEFSFGWLFTINPKNVSESARENVIVYKKECYLALYEYFEGVRKFLEEKESQMEKAIETVKTAKRNFNKARDIKYREENRLSDLSKVTYEQYKLNGFQMELDMDNEFDGGQDDE